MRPWRSRMSALLPAVLAFALGAAVIPQRGAGADANEPPFGILAQATTTNLVNGITDDEVTITGLTTDFSNPYGARWAKVTASIRVQTTTPSTVNGYIDLFQSWNCQTAPCTTRIAGSTTYLPATGGAGSETMVITGFTRLHVGDYYAYVRVKRAVGAGTIAVSSTTGTPQSVIVEDVGDCVC